KLYIINPINDLTDSIEGISSKNFEVKMGSRRDEIGYLAQSVAGFLEKVRQEIGFSAGREEQQQQSENKWWEIVLNAVVPKGSKAFVVDEDNSVLFANFPLNKLDPQQKLHLLDVVDTDSKDMLKLVSKAIEDPGKIIEKDTVFQSLPVRAKIVQVRSVGGFKRMLVLLMKR
ncbi:MAG TPA: hypothetical protein VMW66_04095, partial [Elusimicrobiales bacterium]|nr:hypothetical protein [Elusimicrobiales bacterium]